MCVNRCSFLFNNYTDIFNKVKKDEMDLTILGRLLGVLKLIEEGKVGQHEASVEVGKLLKQIYIDSALKKSEKLDKQHAASGSNASSNASLPPVKKISWTQFKSMNQ
jgi:predicted PolB exonuclease-like 3'-5' exonuclease